MKEDESFVPLSSGATPDASINSFFSFAGFKYGDTMADAHRILGTPVDVDDDLENPFISQYYFPDQSDIEGFELSIDRDTNRIIGLNLQSKDAVYKIRSKGIADPNLSYLGQRWDIIKAKFGNPTVIDKPGNYGYEVHLSPEDRYAGLLINFVCHEADDYICSRIDILWFYADRVI
jgi:hypothetical protein